MIKIDTDGQLFLIDRTDIEIGIREIRKRSAIPVHANGIYRLYDKKGILLYIGRSSKILARVIDHMVGKCENTKRFYEEMYRAEIYLLPFYSKYEIDDIEQYLIELCNPKYNQLKWSEGTAKYRCKEYEV
ncbi:GIY-YIG nuclease family protein [Sporosarcina ureae]|uniref:GIY-YIG nuclease family protein n=1 Tax=Sporosarcina ureae TaxID=1571 RepID=UPI0026EDBD97|nr:GIY-YIG nuclease family protein [Sporosarcina ureae]